MSTKPGEVQIIKPDAMASAAPPQKRRSLDDHRHPVVLEYLIRGLYMLRVTPSLSLLAVLGLGPNVSRPRGRNALL